MKELDKYLNYLHERVFFSRETIGIDVDKFISGKSDKLIIVGPAGSGKSTLGRKLAKKFKVKFFEGDDCWKPAQKKYPDPPIDDVKISEEMNKMYYSCLSTKLRSRQRMIIEGIGFLELFNGTDKEKKLVLSYPTILLGTAAFESAVRTYKRSKNETDESKKINPVFAFLYYGLVNVLMLNGLMNDFRKAKLKNKNSKVQVFKEGLSEAGFEKKPGGWTDNSIKKYSKTFSGKMKGNVKSKDFFDKCVKKMQGKLDNPEGFCASLKDEGHGSTYWRGKGKKPAEVKRDVARNKNV
jgi:hypothetical protein